MTLGARVAHGPEPGEAGRDHAEVDRGEAPQGPGEALSHEGAGRPRRGRRRGQGRPRGRPRAAGLARRERPDRRRQHGGRLAEAGARIVPHRRAGRALEGAVAGGDELLHRGEAIRGRLRERARDQRLDRLGQGHAHVGEAGRRRVEVLLRQLDVLLRAERRPPREHLEEHDPEGVLVGARLDPGAPPLLGRHVARGPHGDAGLGELHRRGVLLVGPAPVDLGQAEVEDPRPRRARRGAAEPLEEHVVRLEIAVDDPGGVRRSQGLGHLARDPPGLLRLDAPARGDLLAEAPPLEQRHHQVGPAIVELADGEDVDDARVLHVVRRPRLALEPRRERGVLGEGPREDLHRDPLLDRRLLGRVHGAHPARAEAVLDAIGTDHGAGLELRRRPGHPQPLRFAASRGAGPEAAAPRERPNARIRSLRCDRATPIRRAVSLTFHPEASSASRRKRAWKRRVASW